MWFILTPQVWTVNISVALGAAISWLSHVRDVKNVYHTQHMLLIMASDPCPHYGQRKKKFILTDEWLIRSVDDGPPPVIR